MSAALHREIAHNPDSGCDVMSRDQIEERGGLSAKKKKLYKHLEAMRLGLSISEVILSPEFRQDE